MSKYDSLVGRKVCKKGSLSKAKPFKSGEKVNTVKAIVKIKDYVESYGGKHIHGATFLEDDSVVECWRLHIQSEE